MEIREPPPTPIREPLEPPMEVLTDLEEERVEKLAMMDGCCLLLWLETTQRGEESDEPQVCPPI